MTLHVFAVTLKKKRLADFSVEVWHFFWLSCCTCSDLEQLRKIRRRSPHDDTEAFTVFLRSDVEAKLVWNTSVTPPKHSQRMAPNLYKQVNFSNQHFHEYLSYVCFGFHSFFAFVLAIRALDVWGSQEALARERNLRKEVEREYEESGFNVSFFLDKWKAVFSIHIGFT